MHFEKTQLKLLLARWMKWDGDLWRSLRDIQIKILFERIIEERPYPELAETYKTTPKKVRQIFFALLIRIEKSVGKAMADFLRAIDKEIELTHLGESNPETGFRFGTIYLN